MAQESKHTLIQAGDGAGTEEFTNIAEVLSIPGPSFSMAAVETTTLDDDAKTFLASAVYDGGEVTIEVNYEPDNATHNGLVTKIKAGTADNYQICYPDFGDTTKTVDSVNTTSEVITTTTAHGLTTGQPIRFTTTGVLPDPLVAGTTYFAEYVAADTFKAYTTNALAIAGAVPVNLTDAGSGTHTVAKPSRYDFSAIVTGVSPTANVDDKITGSITFKISGAVTT